jgi:hypothetical protein
VYQDVDEGGIQAHRLPSAIKTRTNLEGPACRWAALFSETMHGFGAHILTGLAQNSALEKTLASD